MSESERERKSEGERERREVSTTIFGTWLLAERNSTAASSQQKEREGTGELQGKRQQQEKARKSELKRLTGQVEVKRPNESGGQCAGGLLNY